MSTTLKARMVRLEKLYPDLKPGPERMTDEELEGVIGVLRQLEAGEPVDPNPTGSSPGFAGEAVGV